MCTVSGTNESPKMTLKTLTLSESEHYERDLNALTTWGFEPFLLHGGDTLQDSDNIMKSFPEYQLLVYDTSQTENSLVGFCRTTPFQWDGTLADLPPGYDDAIRRHLQTSRRPFNALGGQAIVVREDMQGRGLSHFIIKEIILLAMNKSLIEHILIPARPTLKSKHPLVPIEEYITWKTDDGRIYDPWIRTHLAAGGRILTIAHASMVIVAQISQWIEWTGGKQLFEKSGPHIIHGALVPVNFDLDRGIGTYVEPNVCIHHVIKRS